MSLAMAFFAIVTRLNPASYYKNKIYTTLTCHVLFVLLSCDKTKFDVMNLIKSESTVDLHPTIKAKEENHA